MRRCACAVRRAADDCIDAQVSFYPVIRMRLHGRACVQSDSVGRPVGSGAKRSVQSDLAVLSVVDAVFDECACDIAVLRRD